MKEKLLLLLILFGLVNTQKFTAQVWEAVGSNSGISLGGVGRLSLVNDAQNNPIVGYYDISVAKGSVQKFDGTKWDYLGGSAGMTAGSTNYSSTVVTSNGVVYFSHQAPYPETGLFVRKFENNEWSSLPNAESAQVNYITSVLSKDNTLYVASVANGGTIKKYLNGEWVQVGNTGFFGGVPYYVDMAVGTNNKVYISFNNGGYLHVYMNDINATSSDNWIPVGGNANLAIAPASENYNSSLTIDSNNNLYVAYVSNSTLGNKLNAKKYDGIAWSQLGNENFSSTKVQHVSIAVDTSNKVYIASSIWDSNGSNHLKNYVSSYDDSTNTWSQAGTGFASVDQAIYNSLSTDKNGNLYLAFMDSGLGKLSVKKLNLASVAAASIDVTTINGGEAVINTNAGELQLKATVNPSEASQNVIWSVSEGSTFATVDQNGLVRAIASDHIVKIRATSAENSSIYGELSIDITNQNSPVVATKIDVRTENGNYPDIYSVGNTLKLIAKITPAEADQKVIWSIIGNPNVASVDQNGLVTGMSQGSATIRATHIGGNVYSEIRINVYNSGCSQGNDNDINNILGYSISQGHYKGADDIAIADGTRFYLKNLRLNILSSPTMNITNINLQILKNDNASPGKIIKEIGNLVPAKVTLLGTNTLPDNANHIYEVEIQLPDDLYLDQGHYWISPSVTTENNEKVYWQFAKSNTNSYPYYADALDNNGWVRLGNANYQAVFRATGNCVTMPVIISVVNGGSGNVFVGEELQLQANVESSIPNKNVNWSIVSGNSFSSVDSNGLVKGLARGVAIIRATLSDNADIFGEFEISVLDPNECKQVSPSNTFENGLVFGGTDNVRLATDFEVGAGKKFTVHTIIPSLVNYATNIQFVFHKDLNGLPGEEIQTVDGTIIHDNIPGNNFGYYFHTYTVELETPITFTEGRYWMEIKTNALAWEVTSATVEGHNSAIYRDSTGQWTYSSNPYDFVYQIIGTCDSILATQESTSEGFSIYPNPVSDILHIKSPDKTIEKVQIYNAAGQLVQTFDNPQKNSRIDVSALANGFYIVKIVSKNGEARISKIIKK